METPVSLLSIALVLAMVAFSCTGCYIPYESTDNEASDWYEPPPPPPPPDPDNTSVIVIVIQQQTSSPPAQPTAPRPTGVFRSPSGESHDSRGGTGAPSTGQRPVGVMRSGGR